MNEGMKLLENNLLNRHLLQTHQRFEYELECGYPYVENDENNEILIVRKQYIEDCVKLSLKCYKEQDFSDDLIVVYEDKYNSAVSNEKEFIASCLGVSEGEAVSFHWIDDGETFYGTRYIWKTSSVDEAKLFHKIIISDLGDRTELDCAVYIIDKPTGTVFFLYDDRGLDMFKKLNVEC